MVKRRATAQDVADLAGVSRTAVSLVLNGRAAGNIAAGKQAAILAAAHELNYTPNPVALSLRTRRSATIGAVTDRSDTTGPGRMLLQGAAALAVARGYLLLVLDTGHDTAREERAYDILRDRQVDGFVFAATDLRAYDPHLLSKGVAALINCFDPAGQVAGFIPDEVGASRAVTRCLTEYGHREIVLLSGTAGAMTSELREAGFRQAMLDAGRIPSDPVPAGGDIGGGYAAAMHVLTVRRPRPTALIAPDGRSAVGIVLAAARLGLAVPADLSVVSYDEDQELAPGLVPALTTVRLPYREMGEAAVRYVLDRLADPEETPTPLRVLLDCPVIRRDSVTVPPRAAS